ncbi:TonB-dependent siderophore receptor [Paracandidimonas lactea]|uniref:TonB-dependent siderophore receptor n=1 Tax=Paracandidimonas lactea TaxID=2895524 RepID=UPI001F022CD9|nr:TonB-dependent siderophore receptor [Paracandidimonas lactea]
MTVLHHHPSASSHPRARAARRTACRQALALATLAIPAASAHAQASTHAAPSIPAPASISTLSPIRTQGATAGSGLTEGSSSYTIKATSAGTGLRLSPRDIPQSVSVITRQRIEDQNMTSLDEVMASTPGISTEHYDSERNTFSARGFAIDSYQYDGIPIAFSGPYESGEAAMDPIVFDHIEVVRGATGLLTGAGNPGASINLVRKRAHSKSFAAQLSAGAGRWDAYRATLDVSTPLIASGVVRARLVAAHTDRNTFIDRYHKRHNVLFGTLEADLSHATVLRLGYSYQQNTPKGSLWGGLPLWYSDGTRAEWPRNYSTAARWSSWATTTRSAFAGLTHRFGSGWRIDSLLSHSRHGGDARLLYLHSLPDRTTGLGMKALAGRYLGDRSQTSLDIKAAGPVRLFEREHELVVGVNTSRQIVDFRRRPALSRAPVGSFLHWDGSYPEPQWDPVEQVSSQGHLMQRGMYAVARLNVADPLRVILGGRYTQWERALLDQRQSYEFNKSAVLPYAGILLDLNDNLTAYAAYTSIFNPQARRDREGRWLDPLQGHSYEAGLNGEFLDGSLNATFAFFQVNQDNLAQEDMGYMVPGTTEKAYRAASDTRSRGYELELTGEPLTGWHVFAGLTHWTAREANGNAVQTAHPRTLLRLFSTYRLPGAWQKLTVGGGINWQSEVYNIVTGPKGAERVSQPSYALVNLMSRYQFDKNLRLQINVNNLFDKKYYRQIGFYTQSAWGEPRSFMANLSYRM